MYGVERFIQSMITQQNDFEDLKLNDSAIQLQFIKEKEDFRHFLFILDSQGFLQRMALNSSLSGINFEGNKLEILNKTILSFYALNSQHLVILVMEKQNMRKQLVSAIIKDERLIIQGILIDNVNFNQIQGRKVSRNLKLYKTMHKKCDYGFHALKILLKTVKQQFFQIYCINNETEKKSISYFFYDPAIDTIDQSYLNKVVKNIIDYQLFNQGHYYVLSNGIIQIDTQNEMIQLDQSQKCLLEGKYDIGDYVESNMLLLFPETSKFMISNVEQYISQLFEQQKVVNTIFKQSKTIKQTNINQKLLHQASQIVNNLQQQEYNGFYHIFDTKITNILLKSYHNAKYNDQYDKQLEEQVITLLSSQIGHNFSQMNIQTHNNLYFIQQSNEGAAILISYDLNKQLYIQYQIYIEDKRQPQSQNQIQFNDIKYFKILYDSLAIISVQHMTYIFVIPISLQSQSQNQQYKLCLIKTFEFGPIKQIYHYQRKLMLIVDQNKSVCIQIDNIKDEYKDKMQELKQEAIQILLSLVQLQYALNYDRQLQNDLVIHHIMSKQTTDETKLQNLFLDEQNLKLKQFLLQYEQLLAVYGIKIIVNEPEAGLQLWYKLGMDPLVILALFKFILSNNQEYQLNNFELNDMLTASLNEIKQIYYDGEKLNELYKHLLKYLIFEILRQQISYIVKNQSGKIRTNWIALVDNLYNSFCIDELLEMVCQLQQYGLECELQQVIVTNIVNIIIKLPRNEQLCAKTLSVALYLCKNANFNDIYDILIQNNTIYLLDNINLEYASQFTSKLIENYLLDPQPNKLDYIIKLFKQMNYSSISQIKVINQHNIQYQQLFEYLYDNDLNSLNDLLNTRFRSYLIDISDFHAFIENKFNKLKNCKEELQKLVQFVIKIIGTASQININLIILLIKTQLSILKYQIVDTVNIMSNMDEQQLKSSFSILLDTDEILQHDTITTEELRKFILGELIGEPLLQVNQRYIHTRKSVEEINHPISTQRKQLLEIIHLLENQQLNKTYTQSLFECFPNNQFLQEQAYLQIKTGETLQGIQMLICKLYRLDIAEKYAFELFKEKNDNGGLLLLIQVTVLFFNDINNVRLIPVFEKQLRETIQNNPQQINAVFDEQNQINKAATFLLQLITKYMPYYSVTQLIRQLHSQSLKYKSLQEIPKTLLEILNQQCNEQKLFNSLLVKTNKYLKSISYNQKQTITKIQLEQTCSLCNKPLRSLQNITVINKNIYFCDQCHDIYIKRKQNHQQ